MTARTDAGEAHPAMSVDLMRWTPAAVMSAHALASDPPASIPRQASSITMASKPSLRASIADQATQKSVASPTRKTRFRSRVRR